MSAPATETLEVSGIISVDDHLVEPPELWADRMPGKFVDRARDWNGCEERHFAMVSPGG